MEKHLFIVTAKTFLNGVNVHKTFNRYTEYSSYDDAIRYANRLYKRCINEYGMNSHIAITMYAQLQIGRIVSQHYCL